MAPVHPHAGLVVRVLPAAVAAVGGGVAAVVAVQLDAAVAEDAVVRKDDAPAVHREDCGGNNKSQVGNNARRPRVGRTSVLHNIAIFTPFLKVGVWAYFSVNKAPANRS